MNAALLGSQLNYSLGLDSTAASEAVAYASANGVSAAGLPTSSISISYGASSPSVTLSLDAALGKLTSANGSTWFDYDKTFDSAANSAPAGTNILEGSVLSESSSMQLPRIGNIVNSGPVHSGPPTSETIQSNMQGGSSTQVFPPQTSPDRPSTTPADSSDTKVFTSHQTVLLTNRPTQGFQAPSFQTIAAPSANRVDGHDAGPDSVVSVGPRNGDGGEGAVFRIQRTSAGDTALQVPYTLTFCTSEDTATAEGTTLLRPGATYADVSAAAVRNAPANAEVATLTILPAPRLRLATSAATLFLPGDVSQCSDGALLQAFRHFNSGDAFGALVQRYRGGVLRVCYSVLGNWDDAEDVGQSVFLALAQRHIGLQVTLAAWLATVARNAAIVALRARNRRKRHERSTAKPLEILPGEDTIELREELDTALSRIPPRLGEAVRLRYLDGLSQFEAAEAIGCPRGTLAQRTTYGIRWLRCLFTGELPADPAPAACQNR